MAASGQHPPLDCLNFNKIASIAAADPKQKCECRLRTAVTPTLIQFKMWQNKRAS